MNSKDKKIYPKKEMTDYPLVLTPDHIKEILGIGKSTAYELMDRTDFPTVRIGATKRVARDRFFEWLDQQAMKEEAK